MGLFLGMSCVTLLEIFIYLFKSVWGVFNDERHKTYWGNIIGDDDVDKRRQSYEQIVITTKSKGDPSHTSKPVVEENYAVIRNPATRRSSIMRMGPPTYAEDGRSRSNTVKSTDTIPPALTIRLTRRPSVAVGRRKSVYNAFGNF